MESMDEILDLDELQEGIIDETLREFMIKDEEAFKLLKEKIDELNNEEEKLSLKEEEIKSLEESNREKISSNASPDELIEIAEKIKAAESELSQITDNIEKLESEREELVNTKNNIEKSKQEYVKSLKSTNSNYDEQLKKISDAIEVCDNPTLKQVLDDVKAKKETELNILKEKRNNELKVVLNEVNDNEEPLQDLKTIDNNPQTYINENIVIDNPQIDNKDNIENDIPRTLDSDMINLGSILSNMDEPKEESLPNLNSITTDNLVLPDVNISDINNENKVKIIFEKNVPEILLKEIYTSSRIMPVIYDYLDDKGGHYYNDIK